MKKLLSIILAAAMVLALLAGCSSKPSGESTPPDPTKGPDATQTEQGSEPAGKPLEGQTVKVAALSSGYIDAYPDMWAEVCAAFEEETGAKVELVLEKNLEAVIGPSMQGGDYPDAVLCATGREDGLTEQFIKDKLIADITDVLSMTVPGEDKKVSDKLLGGFTDTTLTNPYGDGKTYLAPMFYSPCGLFYNAGLFAEKGWTIPATWDEMWALADQLPEGQYLFTYPTAGYFDAFFYALMRSFGPDFFNKATSYEEGIWDTEEGKQCLEIVAKLASYTNPVTPAQANNNDFKMNQQLVLDNKALFMPNGTWIVGEMADSPREDGFAWGMTALPAAKAGGNGSSFCWIEQIWVPEGAENMDGGKQFVAFMYSDKAAEIFLKGGAVQPIEGITDKLDGDNKMFYSIYDNGADAAMGGFATTESVAGLGSIMEVYFDPVNTLVSDPSTKDAWINGIKSANDQYRAHLVG